MPSINVDSTIHHGEFMGAQAACALLGVKRATLYAYTSRGMLHSVPGAVGTRERRYPSNEVLRLKARHDARSGHGPVAGGALRWGEPVLDSALTEITVDGPRYRGYAALELARAAVPFEAVAELLWTGELSLAHAVRWPHPVPRATRAGRGRSSVLAEMTVTVAELGRAERHGLPSTRADELRRARTIAVSLANALGARGRAPSPSQGKATAPRPASLAQRIARAWRLDAGNTEVVSALNAALVLCADHELNVSSFAARVVASTGADLYAAVGAALGAFSGPLHGGMSDRVEALIADIKHPQAARRAVRSRLARGEPLAGFAHPLYPLGDPRGRYLLEVAARLASAAELAVVHNVVREARRAAGLEPNVDFGLFALARALGAPSGAAAALFALGRVAGWVAHAMEQRDAGFLLRPRARYVGPSAARSFAPAREVPHRAIS